MAKATTALNTPNDTKYFYPADDQWEMLQLPFKASTAIAEWSAVAPEISSNDVTGYITAMGTTNTTGADFLWILAEPIAATDSDYATAGKLKGVRVPKTPYAKAYFYVWAGTFTAADVFRTVPLHSDSKSLSVDSKWLGARILKYISSTRGICRFSLPETVTA